MTTIREMLDDHNPVPAWTEEELVEWVLGQPEWRRTHLLDMLQEAETRGLNTFRILTKLRAEVGDMERQSGGIGGIIGVGIAIAEGWLAGTTLIHGPAAIRNLANNK